MALDSVRVPGIAARHITINSAIASSVEARYFATVVYICLGDKRDKTFHTGKLIDRLVGRAGGWANTSAEMADAGTAPPAGVSPLLSACDEKE